MRGKQNYRKGHHSKERGSRDASRFMNLSYNLEEDMSNRDEETVTGVGMGSMKGRKRALKLLKRVLEPGLKSILSRKA